MAVQEERPARSRYRLALPPSGASTLFLCLSPQPSSPQPSEPYTNTATLLVIDAGWALCAKLPGTKHKRANAAMKDDLRITSLIFILLLVNLSQGGNWGGPTQYRRHSFLLNLLGVKTDNFCNTVAIRCDYGLSVIITTRCSGSWVPVRLAEDSLALENF